MSLQSSAYSDLAACAARFTFAGSRSYRYQLHRLIAVIHNQHCFSLLCFCNELAEARLRVV